MATAQEPGVARSPGSELPAAARHRHPRGAGRCCGEQSPRFLGDEDVSIDRYISRDWFEREKERLWGAGVAVRLPRGAHPQPRRLHALRDRRASRSSSSGSTRTRSRPTPTPACTAVASSSSTTATATEIRCPSTASRGTRRQLEGRAGAVGPPPRHAGAVRPARDQGRDVGRLRVHQPRSRTPRRWRTSSAAWPSTSSGGTWASRYVQAHVAKEIRANWKIAQEAFCEAFHVNATHPQILPYIGDTNSQVDVWDTFSRVITPAATPSPLLDWAPDEETILRYALDVRVDEELFITIEGGPDRPLGHGRRHPGPLAAGRRRPSSTSGPTPRWSTTSTTRSSRTSTRGGRSTGSSTGSAPTATTIARASWRSSSWRRSRASGRRRRRCAGSAWTSRGPRRRSSACSARCSSRTRSTWSRVQLGLESTRKPGVTLANYQESKVRWSHQLLDEWMKDG